MKKPSRTGRRRAGPPSAGVLLRALLDVWQSGNAIELKAILAKDAVYEDVPNGHTFVGVEEIAGYIAQVHSWASDMKIDVQPIESHSSFAVAEWTMTARQGHPLGTRVPEVTNRKIRLRGTTLVRTSGGGISRAADYLDGLTLVRQLGGRVELPGGGVLGPLTAE